MCKQLLVALVGACPILKAYLGNCVAKCLACAIDHLLDEFAVAAAEHFVFLPLSLELPALLL